ncbi:MAG: hydrogenase nickel incorporation protein HypB [Bdellovibrionales bacterium]|jgi:hydrogenase nickel incorporation protein HypB|nr:hydrogenase nickel incorporation protein HypB [Bdellovibrionales bacterium]MBT3526152.1 hydrogenase nickel incorporation protein HypB [Bdellovibrionales bacterium]MBT7668837.1 hydrogenase nickel incorporation protein HypB [Bdellovibrionales bacterium]MBT7767462.1 hydrogenase nickel incorporation protein HypB [Bdellovibrionales bacterium]
MEIKVLKNVMQKNSAIGNDNRDVFHQKGVYTINLTSSPGAGKTTLLENSLPELMKSLNIAIIEGDPYTTRDAERLAHLNLPTIQVNTEGGCHLDAQMISQAIGELDLDNIDLCVIENVGNLVCPAAFDLGETLRVMVYSITEGADKPKKYYNMFQGSHVILINKVELAELCNIDLEATYQEVREINPTCKIFQISATRPETLIEWNSWLAHTVKKAICQ